MVPRPGSGQDQALFAAGLNRAREFGWIARAAPHIHPEAVRVPAVQAPLAENLPGGLDLHPRGNAATEAPGSC